MARHFPLRLVAAVAVALSVGAASGQEAAPKPVPVADDLLEQARKRQRVAEELAGTEVAAAEAQVVMAYLLWPSAVRPIATKARDAVADNPDISDACRQRLLDRLGRFLRD